MSNDPFADQPAPQTTDAAGSDPSAAPAGDAPPKIPVGRIALAVGIFLVLGAGTMYLLLQSDAPKVTGLQGGTTVKVEDPNLGKPKDLKQIVDVMSAQVGTLTKRLDEADKNQNRVIASLGAIERRLGIAETGLRGVASQNPEDMERQRLIESLSDEQRSIIPEATTYLNNLARDRGLFGPTDAQPLFETWCQARLTRGGGASIQDLFTVCRVRREPLTDGHVRSANSLAAQREAKKVKASDLPALARMVWEARGSYPAATPGQMLALGQMVGQMAGGLPQESSSATPVAALVGPGSGPQLPVAQPALVAGYSVAAADIPLLLAAAAPLLPDADGSEMLRGGAALPFATALGDGVRGVLTDRAYVQALASVTGGLGGFDAEALTLAGIPSADVPRVSAVVRGLLLGDLVAQARIHDQGAAVSRQAIALRFAEAQKLLDERFLLSLKSYQPVRWTLALADRLGVRHPDFARLDLAALDGDARIAMDEVRAKGVLPGDLLPAFEVQAPLAAVAGQIVRTGDAAVATRQAVYRSAVYLLAAQQAAQSIRGRLLQVYATMFGTSTRNWSDTAVEAERQAHIAIVEGLAGNDMSLDVAGIPVLVPVIARHATLAAEQHLAVTAVRDHVYAGLNRAAVGASAGLAKRVKTWADEQITTRIVPPFEVDRLSVDALAIRQDVEAMLAGRKRLPQDTSGATKRTLGSVKRSGGLIITSFDSDAQATTRTLTIPAGSYGEAKLFSGADIELGGQQKEILINLDYSWRGPTDTVLKMRNLRIIGIAQAQGGPARASVALKTMSYVFPSGRAWTSPVAGYVVDHVHGMHGVVGEWNLNVKEVLPLAGGTSLLAGIGAALTPNTDTIVNSSTTVITSDATALQKGTSEAFNKSVDPLVKMTDRILSQCNASISVPNGQPITCVLTESVQIEIPSDEYDSVVETVSTTNFRGGFAHAR